MPAAARAPTIRGSRLNRTSGAGQGDDGEAGESTLTRERSAAWNTGAIGPSSEPGPYARNEPTTERCGSTSPPKTTVALGASRASPDSPAPAGAAGARGTWPTGRVNSVVTRTAGGPSIASAGE